MREEEEGVGNRAEYKVKQLYARVAVVFSDHYVNFGSPSLFWDCKGPHCVTFTVR